MSKRHSESSVPRHSSSEEPKKGADSQNSRKTASASSQNYLLDLMELRRRLFWIVGTVFVFLLIFACLSNGLYEWVSVPLMKVLPIGSSMIATEMLSPLIIPLKLALCMAFFTAVPIIFYHFWAFVSPALYLKERRLIWFLLLASSLLFYTGVGFVYFIILPLMFHFLIATLPTGIKMMPDMGSYLDFMMKLFVAFGFVFQIPLIIFTLIQVDFVSHVTLCRYRPHIIVTAFVLGMLLTPPDVISQIALAIPIWFLFEAGLWFGQFFKKHQNAVKK